MTSPTLPTVSLRDFGMLLAALALARLAPAFRRSALRAAKGSAS